MKSQILQFKYILVPLFIVSLHSQPKISVDLGTGFYEPTMKGFDSNELVSFPTGNILTRNLLINFSTFYEFFYKLFLCKLFYLYLKYFYKNPLMRVKLLFPKDSPL